MTRYTQSKMHEQRNLILFRGRERAESGEYLFAESHLLFGKENLSPRLFEHDEEVLPFSLSKSPLTEILEGIALDEARFLNIIDVRIDDSKFDISLSYESRLMDEFSVRYLEDVLKQVGKFSVLTKEKFVFKPTVTDVDSKAQKYIQVCYSNRLLKRGGNGLSTYLHGHFSPTRYSDTEVASFLIMTSLAGTSSKECL